MDPSVGFEIAGLLFKFLGSPILKEIKDIWKYEEDIKMLADTVDIIGDVLNDVEGMSYQESVNKGYKRLREAYLDAQDFLDRVHTLKKKQELMATQIEEAKAEIIKPNGKGKLSFAYVGMKMKPTIDKGRRFFSSSNQAKYAVEVHDAIKEIRKKLDAILHDQKFRLVEPSSRSEITLTTARATGSCVNASRIIGRDEDKREIVSLLLKSSVDDRKIPVISIVGIGGIGKTTVAQLVFDDKSWQTICEFDMKLWVSDSKKHDLKSMLKHILKDIDPKDISLDSLEEDHLKRRLVDEIQGKRFLLVLDDVDNEDPYGWEKLEELLEKGNKGGSRILVTTRSRKVAEVVGSLYDSTYELDGLSDEDSLQLFETHAFQERGAGNLVEIVEQIVTKCCGVPLAVKVIGSYLQGKDKHKWEFVRDNSFADIRDEKNQILPILKLSYHDLDSTVKQCFSYCAIFPRNWLGSKESLKAIWMHNVRFRNSGGTLEDVCDKSLTILLDRCFLQETAEDGEIYMHDLMYDLAKEVAAPDILVVYPNFKVDLNKLIVEENVRHLFLMGTTPIVESKGKRLRTIFILADGIQQITLSWIVSECPVLRVLDVGKSEIEILPDSIGKLIHLRILRLNCSEVQTLPNSIIELINLQILSLAYCRNLTDLPSGMGALMSLEYFNLHGCDKLEELPRGIEKLMKLKWLCLEGCDALAIMPSGIGALMPVCTPARFIVGHPESSNHTAQLEELGSLSDLVEDLIIELPRNITSKVPAWDGQEFLLNKRSLRDLVIRWQGNPNLEEEVPTNSMDILANLQPPPNLKNFKLDGYQGMAFPPWVAQHGFAFVLPNLVFLRIKNCRRCRSLPSFSKLQCLKYLNLLDLSSLEYVADNVSIEPFCLPQLETLVLQDLPELMGWCRGLVVGVNDDDNTHTQSTMLSFPRLSYVELLDCPNFTVQSFLSSFDISHFRSGLSSNIVFLTEYGPLHFFMEKDSLCLKTTSFDGTETASDYLAEAFRVILDHVTFLVIGTHQWNTLPQLLQITSLRELCIEECCIARVDEVGDEEEEEEEESVGEEIESTSLHTAHHPHMSWSGLTNLQRLTLIGIEKLTRLPKWILFLTSLRVLYMEDCGDRQIPKWMRKFFRSKEVSGSAFLLFNWFSEEVVTTPSRVNEFVRTLSMYIVGHPESFNAQLEELEHFSGECKDLTLVLPNFTWQAPIGDSAAFLLNKKNWRELEIRWQGNPNPGEEGPTNSMDILAKLQPSLNLKKFKLDGYQGMAFPPRVAQHGFAFVLPNLVSLCIQNCRRCQYLPFFSKLQCLKKLKLGGLSSLEYIEDSVPNEPFCLPQLEILVLKDLPELKSWCRGPVAGVNDDDNTHTQSTMLSFPRLSYVRLWDCPNFTVQSFLSSFSISHFRSGLSSTINVYTEYVMLSLSMEEKDSLSLEIRGLSGTEIASNYLAGPFRAISDHVTHLVISKCRLNALSGLRQLTALRHLEIVDCPDFTGKEKEEEQSMGDEIESTALHTTHHPHMPWSGLTSLQTLTFKLLPKLLRLPKWILFLTSLQVLHIEDCHNLRTSNWAPEFFNSKKVVSSAFLFKWFRREMVPVPSQMGALTPVRALDMFIVGHPESFSAELKELEHFPDDCTWLFIVLPNFTRKAPAGDSEAFLLNNKSLIYFWIWWLHNQNVEEEVLKTHIDILGKLQPLPNLRSFMLSEYQGIMFPPWATQHGFASVMPNLVHLYIEGCRRCRYLPSMRRLECLKHLELLGLSSLEYIEENVSTAPFCLPKLEELVLRDLPELKGWCRGNTQPLLLSSFPRLLALEVSSCPNLTVPPLLSFAKVSDLESRVEEGLFPQVNVYVDDLGLSLYLGRDSLCLLISNFNDTESELSYMAESFRGMSDRLTTLHIWKCTGLTTLPGILQHLSALRTLVISECPNFTWEEEEEEKEEKQSVADEIQSTSHDAHTWWKGLSSLQLLILKQLPKMVRLPEGIQFLTSLQNLNIDDCDNLLIPEWLHKIFPYKKVDSGRKQFRLVKEEMDGCSSSTSI